MAVKYQGGKAVPHIGTTENNPEAARAYKELMTKQELKPYMNKAGVALRDLRVALQSAYSVGKTSPGHFTTLNKALDDLQQLEVSIMKVNNVG